MEMGQALYAHMNNKIINKKIKDGDGRYTLQEGHCGG
jgi:hypothetical protein